MATYEKRDTRSKLEEAIRESGLLKGHLAKLLGVTPQTISNWIKKSPPIPDNKLEELVAILKRHGVDASAEEIRAVNGHPKPRGRPRKVPVDHRRRDDRFERVPFRVEPGAPRPLAGQIAAGEPKEVPEPFAEPEPTKKRRKARPKKGPFKRSR